MGGYYFSKMKGDDKNDERGIWQKLLPSVYKFWMHFLKWQRVTLTLFLVHRIHKTLTFVQVNNSQK